MRRAGLPVPLAQRNWSGFVLGTVCTTAGIATWSFVVGGASAYYLDAKMGVAAMLAGGLIGQLLVSLATLPSSTKHGIETVVSTKPMLGVRGSYISLMILYATALGWNTVLMIFFGRSAASILEILGVAPPGSRGTVSTVIAAIGIVVVWWMVGKGTNALEKVGPVVAITIAVMALYLLYILIDQHGLEAISTAKPLEAWPDRLLNYTSVIELLAVSTLGWWAYMGGMVRMVNTARKAVLPSMLGLGVAWVLVACVSLFSALVVGQADPTVWAPKLAGGIGGMLVLLFVALANLGSTHVGAFVATLAVSQIPQVSNHLSWRVISAIVLAPMLLVTVLAGDQFYDNVSKFIAFLGLMIAPMVGIQIMDWYVLGRRHSMRLSDLYLHDKRSRYWYIAGFNPAGIIALVAGSITYMMLLDPVTYIPRSDAFKYVTATLPSVAIGAVTYLLVHALTARWVDPGPREAQAEDSSETTPSPAFERER
jgi:nucleobase:cation symporter-1, NCS1 family